MLLLAKRLRERDDSRGKLIFALPRTAGELAGKQGHDKQRWAEETNPNERERERACMPVSRETVRGKQINIGPGSNSLAAPHTPPQMGMRGSAAYIFIIFILYVYIYSYVHKIQCPDPSQWPAQASGAAHTRMYRYKLLGPPPSWGRLPMYTPPSYVHRRYTPPPRQRGFLRPLLGAVPVSQSLRPQDPPDGRPHATTSAPLVHHS